MCEYLKTLNQAFPLQDFIDQYAQGTYNRKNFMHKYYSDGGMRYISEIVDGMKPKFLKALGLGAKLGYETVGTMWVPCRIAFNELIAEGEAEKKLKLPFRDKDAETHLFGYYVVKSTKNKLKKALAA